ncbi:MAG: hypothetical protein RKE49_05510 [Oceanicaulis sp.]
MNWFLSVLAGLALLVAGAGVCPSAHGLEAHAAMAGAPSQPAPGVHDMDEPCHGEDSETADTEPRPAGDTAACCDGGAACGDCALLTVTLADPAAEPGAPALGHLRAFRPDAAPTLVFAFDPPPPRAAHA